jgi:UDP-N-acetylmuramoyl-tripeptide--D-alanyl-D-alanine ligase
MIFSNMPDFFQLLGHWFLMLGLGFYLITNLQWHRYEIKRLVLVRTNRRWHFVYFVSPLVIYFVAQDFFLMFLYGVYLPSLYFWHRGLEHQLLLNGRVVRFFLILMGLVMLNDVLCVMHGSCVMYAVCLPLIFTLILSAILERFRE